MRRDLHFVSLGLLYKRTLKNTPMNKNISIKNFRNNMANIADSVEEGTSYVVIRRSQPSFKVVPMTSTEDEQWETVVDFTEGGKVKGEKIEDVLKLLKKINNE